MSTYGWSHLSGVGNVTSLPASVPGGPNKAVQYNNGGNFNGNNTFTFDNTLGSEQITAPLIKVSNNVEPVVDGAGQVGTTVHKWGNINSVAARINDLEVLNNVVPIVTNTGQVGTVTKRWGNMNAGSATIESATLNSIYDSTNSIGVTGYVLGNNLGNIVWQPISTTPLYMMASTTGFRDVPGSSTVVIEFDQFNYNNGFAPTSFPQTTFQSLFAGVYEASITLWLGNASIPTLNTTARLFTLTNTPVGVQVIDVRHTLGHSESCHLSSTHFFTLTSTGASSLFNYSLENMGTAIVRIHAAILVVRRIE
jgi:hypothetical protein